MKLEIERQTPYDIAYMWNLKYDRNQPIYETETNSQVWKTDLWLPRGSGWGRDQLGVWDQQMQTIYREWINSLWSTGPTVQHREQFSTFCDKP